MSKSIGSYRARHNPLIVSRCGNTKFGTSHRAYRYHTAGSFAVRYSERGAIFWHCDLRAILMWERSSGKNVERSSGNVENPIKRFRAKRSVSIASGTLVLLQTSNRREGRSDNLQRFICKLFEEGCKSFKEGCNQERNDDIAGS